jgi:hypothetical protein
MRVERLRNPMGITAPNIPANGTIFTIEYEVIIVIKLRGINILLANRLVKAPK